MLNDIYARNPLDPNYVIGQLEMENSLELFKQQIENCLFTPKTTVLGDIDFGASLDEYLWSFNLSASAIKTAVTQQINTYCTLGKYYSYSVSVEIYKGTIKDIAQISIDINNGAGKFSVIVG